MKIGHAAALALVGWYLMIPPPGAHGPNLAAPLNQWVYAPVKRKQRCAFQSYSTLEECEARKRKDLKDCIVVEGEDDPILSDARCVRSDELPKPVPLRRMPPPKSGFVPLSQWTRVGAFQSEEYWDSKRAALSKMESSLGDYRRLPAEQVYDAQCPGSDDPRLKP
jgi:hypothetical protein